MKSEPKRSEFTTSLPRVKAHHSRGGWFAPRAAAAQFQ
jgi:hypothetical protein